MELTHEQVRAMADGWWTPELIRAFRLTLGLTQKELAARLFFSRRETVAELEAGKYQPNLQTIGLLSMLFKENQLSIGLEMNWLSGEKPMGNFLDAARERLPVVSGTSSHSPPSQMLTAGLTLFMPSYDEANLRQEVSDVAEKAGFEVLKIDIKEWRQLIRGY